MLEILYIQLLLFAIGSGGIDNNTSAVLVQGIHLFT